jgi:hypothetical protein
LFLLQNVTVVQEAQDLFASIDDHEGIDKAEPCRGMGGFMTGSQWVYNKQ